MGAGPTTVAGARAQCQRNRAAVRSVNGGVHANQTYARLNYLATRCKEPPFAAVYQDWLDANRNPDPRGGKIGATGEKLRRAVRLIRNGCSIAECERTVGARIRHFIKLLPPDLAA